MLKVESVIKRVPRCEDCYFLKTSLFIYLRFIKCIRVSEEVLLHLLLCDENFPVADWAPQPGMKRDPCQRLKVSLFKAPRGSWPVPSALQNCANPAGWKLSQLLSVYTSVSPFTSRCHLCDFSFPFCAKSLWGQDQ